MIGEMYDATRFMVAYMLVACDHCDAPLMDEESRIAGFCADCLKLTESEIASVEDPYGQPVEVEVMA